MNYAFAELISNLQTISSSNPHYIYPKDKPLCLIEKIRDVEISILDQNENCLCYTLLFGKLSDVKNLACIYRQKGLTFLFE